MRCMVAAAPKLLCALIALTYAAVAMPQNALAYRAPDTANPVRPLQDPPSAQSADDDEEWLADPHSGDVDTTAMPPVSGFNSGDIRYGSTALPDAVAATRTALMNAARSGDINALRPIFAKQRAAPVVLLDHVVDDAVDHLQLQSGDADGVEILALLLEILESGYVRDETGPRPSYVWPFFALVPLPELSPSQRVDVYRLLTSIDVEEMQLIGSYTFFRVVIGEDGAVRYFTAGQWE